MSTTTTGAVSTSTGCGTPHQYEIPVDDAACGVPNTNKYKGYLSACAKPAGITEYNNDCAIYALAVDQSVQDLTDCLYEAGVKWEDVWCHGSTNATATATSYPTSTETASKKSSTTETGKSTGTATGTSTESAASSTSTSGAASLPKAHTSLKAVMLVSTLLFSAALVGL